MTKLTPTVHETAEAYLRLSRTLSRAKDIQWSASPIPKPREDTASREIGGYGDPTADIATDKRRMAVSELVARTEAELRTAANKFSQLQTELDQAISRWEG